MISISQNYRYRCYHAISAANVIWLEFLFGDTPFQQCVGGETVGGQLDILELNSQITDYLVGLLARRKCVKSNMNPNKLQVLKSTAAKVLDTVGCVCFNYQV